jgi:hypothetical protein
LPAEVLVWVDIIKYSIIIFPIIFKTAMAERPNNLFCILLEAVLEFMFLSALVAKNIKKYSHQDTICRGGHKDFTKKNKRNSLNQKSKTTSK